MRCEVAARSAKRRSASRTASAKPAPPGTTSSGWRSPSSPSAVHSARSASSPLAAETAADLDDGQHGSRAPPAARRAPRRAPPRRRSRPTARAVGDRSPQARGDLAGQEGAGADRDDGRLGRQRALHPARRVLDLAQLLGVQERRDRVDLVRRRAARRRSTPAGRCARARTRPWPGGRRASGSRTPPARRWPRTRWTSALIAKYSDDTGHQPPRTGTRGAIAARLVRSTPV